MNNLQVQILTVIFSLCMALFTDGASLSHLRNKRQTADVRTTEYLARLGLGRGLNSYGCRDIACGVVDIYRSGKKKRGDTGKLGDSSVEVGDVDLLRALIRQSLQENSV
ncbi:hypothetical protein LOTGIDRAFT_228375 [Lottia gigantea]|uniref:Uncharacterized protein n=1 Tax=Lottia gigantea TaxID=225164 RepID=V4AVF7_LOTGI|nr:hypothetical protein LOTGIDRAFT_228375 [Lottia gigantea]ESO97821.1 hypothetical protein LOTGIDRAFT_228375 [Lottia gigantea]